MPLNSVKCPQCGAHVNYSVDVDADVQEVTCRRCKAVTTLKLSDLDEVIRTTVLDLRTQRAAESELLKEYTNETILAEDSVEESLERAQSAFTEAKDRLFGLVEELDDMTDTMAIVDEFAVGESVESLGQSESGSSQSGVKSRFEQAVSNKVQEKIADSKYAKEEQLALYYGKELFTYCKSRNIKLVDAVSDSDWQKWFIGTLKVDEDTKASLAKLVQTDGFKAKVSSVFKRFQ